jgi:hypothetical protein
VAKQVAWRHGVKAILTTEDVMMQYVKGSKAKEMQISDAIRHQSNS